MSGTTVNDEEVPEAVEKLAQRQKALHSIQGFLNAANIELEPEDVLLCCGVKSGTTWLQHIVHGLRSGGSMDFDEICNVIPTVEFSCDDGFPSLDVPQLHPRAFKTQLPFGASPKTTGKRIVITRNPADAAVSFYYFYGSWLFELEELSLEDFIEWMIIRERPPATPAANAFQMQHLASWYPYRNDENTLWLHYEDMIADLSQCIKMISDFLDIGVGNTQLLKLVEQQASFEFMKKHRSKFDEHPAKLKRNPLCGLPSNHGIENNPGKVRAGRVNDGMRLLSEDMKEKIAKKWKSVVEPVTGYTTYEDMRAAINKEHGRMFPSL